MDIYIPWFPAVLDKRVLRTLKESSVIDGVELSGLRAETDTIRSAGFKVSLHNPLKEFGVDLSNTDFKDVAESVGIRTIIERADADFISFHLGFTRIHQARSGESIFKAAAENIAYLNSLTDKAILFETPNYFIKHSGTCIGEVFDDITSPEFIERLLCNSDCGFLLDISHVFISGMTKELTGKCRFDEYFNELISRCAPFVRQLHINIPKIEDELGFSDVHGFHIPGEGMSCLVAGLCKKVFSRCRNILAVTLEMNSSDAAAGDRLIEQARFVLDEMIS